MIRERTQRLARGDCIAVPLQSGGWASAVVVHTPAGANTSQRSAIAYFFGPRTSMPRGPTELHWLTADQALFADRISPGFCGSFRLPVVGRIGSVKESDWPIPSFFSVSRLPGPDGVIVPKFAIHDFACGEFDVARRIRDACSHEIKGLRPVYLPNIRALENSLEWHIDQGKSDPPYVAMLKDPRPIAFEQPLPRPPGRIVLPTCEAGDWTAIPVSDVEWVPARIARVSRGKVAPKIAVILLYIFDRRMRGDIDATALATLRPEDARLVEVTWDDRIRESKWPLVKSQGSFDPTRWPIPVFGIRSARGNPDGTASELFFEAHHRDDRLGEVERYVEVDQSRYEALPPERSLTDVEVVEQVSTAIAYAGAGNSLSAAG